MKINIIILTILVCFVLIGHVSSAQTVDTSLSWSATSFDNASNNEHVSYSCSFETNSQKIKWIQKGGARVYEFQINSKTGSWTDVKQDGEVVYSVTFRGNQGTIKVYRRDGDVMLEMDIPVEGNNMLPYKFTINSITAL